MDDRRAISDAHLAEDRLAEREPLYAGLRMTADEFEALSDDGFRYELIDGVVVMMAPSPIFEHQDVASEIERQIRNYLDKHPVGRTAREMDVNFDSTHVYRPDLVFLSVERFPRRTPRIRVAPDMVLEVLSPSTRGRDLKTKRHDYERFGVTEYWIVDPRTAKFTFLRLGAAGKETGKVTGKATGKAPAKSGYQSVAPKGSKFASAAIPGFTLDIAAVKRVLRD